MPRKSVEERMEKYIQKLTPDRIKQLFEVRRESMIAAQRVRMAELAQVEDRVKGVLAGEAVKTVTYIWYHDFARETYSLSKRFGGGKGLEDEVDILIAKWKARGAIESVLKKVRDEVFSIAPPE